MKVFIKIISCIAIALSLNSCLMFEDLEFEGLESKPYKYEVLTCVPCEITCFVGNDIKQYHCSANNVWTLELPTYQKYFCILVQGTERWSKDYSNVYIEKDGERTYGNVIAEIKWGDEIQSIDIASGFDIAEAELSLY